jgi:hypothetical protein
MSKTVSGMRDIVAGNGETMLGRLRCTTFHSRGFFEIKQTCYSGFHRTVENSVEKRDYARERHVGLVVCGILHKNAATHSERAPVPATPPSSP